MTGRRLLVFLTAAILATMVWVAEVLGHGRRHRESPALPPPAPAEPVKGKTPSDFPAATGPGGDPQTVIRDLCRRFNLEPSHPKAAAVLLELARTARADGQVAKAMAAYGLAISLFPQSPLSVTARQEKLVLTFYQDLACLPPLTACRRFLEQAAALSVLAPPTFAFQEALRHGWQAVEGQVDRENPVPPAVAEDVLALWDLHPPESRPPEACLFMARIFKERGLAGEAQQLLRQVLAFQEEHLRGQALAGLLELAWMTQGLPGFLATLAHFHEEKLAVSQALRTWMLHWGSPGGGSDGKAPAAPAALPPEKRLKFWQALAGQPLPPALAAHMLADLAACRLSDKEGAEAARLYDQVLEGAKAELGAGFYHYRLGLNHSRRRQFQAAQEAFQAAALDEDPLWQQVARVRLLDLELARSQSPASP